MEDKRAHIRIKYRGYGTLIDAHEKRHACHLINLSRGGALVALLMEHDFDQSDRITLEIELGGDESAKMCGYIIHQKDHFIGLKCEAADEEDALRLASLLTEKTP